MVFAEKNLINITGHSSHAVEELPVVLDSSRSQVSAVVKLVVLEEL